MSATARMRRYRERRRLPCHRWSLLRVSWSRSVTVLRVPGGGNSDLARRFWRDAAAGRRWRRDARGAGVRHRLRGAIDVRGGRHGGLRRRDRAVDSTGSLATRGSHRIDEMMLIDLWSRSLIVCTAFMSAFG